MGRRKTNRRDFLTGKSALGAIEDALPEVEPGDGASSVGDEFAGASGAYLLEVGRRAMACQFQVLLNAGQHLQGTEAALAALDLVDRLEDQMTVYRPDSEVSQINQTAGQEPMVVEPRLFQLLEQAVELHRQTQGAFDITSGPLTKAWGFYRRAGRLPTAAERQAALECVGSQFLALDPVHRTIHFLRDGMEINLGAIGKGHALDRCAELLRGAGVENFLIHGGQSSILAQGSRLRARPQRPGWRVAIRHPLRPQQRVAEVWLQDRALGTSGSGQQFFHYRGRRYGHVLDPRTGTSVEGVLSVTVLAPTAALADALSTAFFVLGVEHSLEFCRAHSEIGAALFTQGKRSGEICQHGCGLRDDEFRWTA